MPATKETDVHLALHFIDDFGRPVPETFQLCIHQVVRRILQAQPNPCVVHFTQTCLAGALSWLGPRGTKLPAPHPRFDTDVLQLSSMHHHADQHYALGTRQIYHFFSLHKFGNVQTLPIVSLSPRKEKYISGRFSAPPRPTHPKPAGKNVCVYAACVYSTCMDLPVCQSVVHQ